MLGIGIIAPLLPIYADNLGATGIWIGIVFAGFSISRAIIMPFIGKLSDQHGRKRFICIGLLLYAITSLGFIWADSVYQLVLVRFLQGAVAAMIVPIAQAYMGDLAPEGEEGKWMGYFNAVFFTGFGLGPLMGGALSEQLASRLRKTLPPELQDNEAVQPDPQAQQMLQQADAQIQQLTQQNEYLEGVVRQLQAKDIADHEKNKTDIIQTVIKEEGAMARERLKQDGLDARQQEEIEAEASKDMMRYAESILAEEGGQVTEAMAPGSEDYVPQVMGPVAYQPDSIEFEDDDEPVTMDFE